MSSEYTCEKQVRRKSKVSWGRLIHPGLVGPKPRLYSVGDGQSVNIRIPARQRYTLDMTRGVFRSAECWTSRSPLEKFGGGTPSVSAGEVL